MNRTVSVTVELLEVEYGVWCDTCLLPSRAVATYAITVGSRTSVAAKSVCDDGDH